MPVYILSDELMKLYDLKPEIRTVKPEVIDSWYLYLITRLIYIIYVKPNLSGNSLIDVDEMWIEIRLNLFPVHVHLLLLVSK